MEGEELRLNNGACSCENYRKQSRYCCYKFELCLILPIVAIIAAISVFVILLCSEVRHTGDNRVHYYYSAPIDVNVDELKGNWLSMPNSCSNSTKEFLRQIGVPANMIGAVITTNMEITIGFQFNPQIGSVTTIRANPNHRELLDQTHDTSKTILLHNNRWTDNNVMEKTYFLNFPGKYTIYSDYA